MEPNAKQEDQPQQPQPVPAAPVQQPAQQPVPHTSHQKFEAIPYKDFPWTKVFFIICMIGLIFLLAALGLLYYTKNKQAMVSNTRVQQVQSSPTVKVMPTAIPTLNTQIDKDFWRADVSSFSAEDLQSLQQLILKGGEPKQGKLIVSYIERIGNYGDLSTEIIEKSTNQPLQTEPGYGAFYKDTNNTWQLLSGAEFCSKIKKFPQKIAEVSNYFCK